MDNGRSQCSFCGKMILPIQRLYGLLAPRAYSVIMFGALFCTLAVKLFHSFKNDLLGEYLGWILADVSVLLGIEVVLSIICFRRPGKKVVRSVTVFAAIVCTWSVMNAGWVIKTGTQILPATLLPLVRDPLNSLSIIGVSLVKMPGAAFILLGPSAVALTFFFFVLARPPLPVYNRKSFAKKIIISVIIIFVAALARGATRKQGSSQTASVGLRYNCHLRAVTGFFISGSSRLTKTDMDNARRKIPVFDEFEIALADQQRQINHNVVIVILEGIQYRLTSLARDKDDPTPFLAGLAGRGAEFSNTRTSLTHTTKALFPLLTGRLPSISQDIAEAVPVAKPYAGLATILKQQLGYRSAFFQSAKGNFECRPGLVYNLGFDKFWARDNLNDPNAFLGYLACDEFSMLKPISKWIKADSGPFLVVILCSVSHDPYEVPEWFAAPARKPFERYLQAIRYTDKFLEALDEELAGLNLSDNTIYCVIGDHGEAFGEHGLSGHQRIAFEETLRIPWVMRAPSLLEPQRRITEPVSSIDLTPTLLGLLGFDTRSAHFDGIDALGVIPDKRKVYFSCWMQEGPVGFIQGKDKFIYNPTTKTVSVYDLSADPCELNRTELQQQQGQEIAEEIFAWRKNSIFRLDRPYVERKILFDSYLCYRRANRVWRAKYQPNVQN